MLLTKSGIRSAGALGMLLVAVSAANAGALAPQKKAPADSRLSTGQAQRLLASRSAHFIENKGQWDPRARFLARTESLDLWFTDQGIRYDNYRSSGGTNRRYMSHVVDMAFAGGRNVQPVASQKARAKIDFVTKGSKTKGASTYDQLLAKNVYKGIDVRSYIDNAKPRYDVIVAPGADAKQIKLAFKGDNGLKIDKGTLQVGTNVGGFANGKPLAYQTVNGKRVPVSASWKLAGKHEATFALGNYDHSKTLVIDPLVYGSYFGGNNGADEIRAVVADDDGGVFLAGGTRSAIFPVRYGPFGLNIHGGEDALIAKLQGDAYNYEYASYIGGSGDDVGSFLKRDGAGNVWMAGTTKSLDFPGNTRNFIQYFGANSRNAASLPDGGTFRIGVVFDALGNSIPNGDAGSTNSIFSPALPFNATVAQVQTALTNLGLTATVTSVRGGNRLPTAKLQITMPSTQALSLTGDSVYRTRAGAVINEGLPPSFHIIAPPTPTPPVNPTAANPTGNPSDAIGGPIDTPYSNTQTIHRYGSTPSGGTYTVKFRNFPAPPTNPTSAITTPLVVPDNAGAFNLLTALNALGNKGTITFFGAGGELAPIGGGSTDLTIIMVDSANPPGPSPQKALVFDNTLIQPQMAYVENADLGVNGGDNSDIFVMRFEKSATTVLDPTTNPAILIFGSPDTDRFSSFDIRPGATASDPVEFILAGSSRQKITDYPSATFPGSGFEWVGFLARYQWTLGGGFTQVAHATNGSNAADPSNDLPYIESHNGLQVDVRGAVLDSDGNAYVSGTVYGTKNVNTSSTSVDFYTANNVGSTNLKYEDKEYGNQLRNVDVFVRKYARDGSPLFSGLFGGINNDEAGGIVLDQDSTYTNTGSNIAIDSARNIYITGTSGSFDFLRTRGVYGEVFTDTSNVFVTKISADGASILYSTNLRMSSDNMFPQPALFGEQNPTYVNGAAGGGVTPAGIAVDSRGYAYVTTNLIPSVNFPGPGAPGDPNQPTGSTHPAIPLVGAIDGTYDGPTNAEFATREGGLTILNSTGTDLVFSTYLGGALDEMVYAPYVDSGGDVWAVGWTDSFRGYVRVSSTGTVTQYQTASQLPDSLISEFAFKQTPDYQSGGSFGINIGYGTFNHNPLASGLDQDGFVTPNYVPMSFSRDGFVTRFRIDLPSVADITFNPATVPGGLGSFTTGTVTLTQAAPSGGSQVVVTLPNGTAAASLSDTLSDLDTITITIPAGATQATFQVFTKGVTANTGVSVRATVSGTFRERTFQVVPWLVSMTLATDTMIGGDPNMLRGTVTIAAPAPAGGAEISLSSSSTNATIVDVPFTVPAGQTSASFNIDSRGVDANELVNIQATLLGVAKTQSFTLLPSQLQSVTVSPDTIAGGSTSSILLTMNGKAGDAGYVVNLTSSDPSVVISPSTVTIPAQATSSAGITVTITTSAVATDKAVTITATHPASSGHPTISKTTTLHIQAFTIASLSLNPSTVESGATATGTVTLATSAPAGGAIVTITSGTPGVAAVQGTGTLTIPAGSKTATFTVKADYVGVATPVVITAQQGIGQTKTATLTVNPIAYTLKLSPTSTIGSSVGSTTVTGTVTLTTAAPTRALVLDVTTNSATIFPVGTFDATVTIASGSKTGTFVLHPKSVTAPTTVSVTVSFNGGSKSANLVVRPVGILSLTARQKVVRSGTGAINLTAAFEAETGAGGELVLATNLPSAFAPGFFVKHTSGPYAGLGYVHVYPIDAGITSFAIPSLSVNRLSRSQDVTFTGTYNSTSAATTVTVSR